MSPRTRRIFLQLAFVAGLGGVTIYAVRAHVAEAKSPSIWNEILQTTRDIFADPQRPSDPFELSKKFPPWALEIAHRYDRDDVEALSRTFEAVFPQCRNIDEQLYAPRLAELVIAEIVDANDRLGFKYVYQDWSSFANVPAFAIAAADSYHDLRAQEFLLDAALDDGRLSDAVPVVRSHFSKPSAAGLAVQLLRGYSSAPVLEKLRAALHAEQQLKRDVPALKLPQRTSREADLQAAITSMDYGAKLSDGRRREAFLSFETRLWRARAIGPTGYRSLSRQFGAAAELVDRTWQSGDEEFVMRIFEEPHSTPDEAQIASDLLHRLSDADRGRIDAVAQSESPQAVFARQAMRVWGVRSKSKLGF